MKKKHIALIVAAVLIIPFLVFIALAIHAAKSVFGCPVYIYDQEKIVNIAQEGLEIQVPEKANNLCFAVSCGIDYADCYLSLTLSDKERCKQFLEVFDVSLSDFQNVLNLPEEYQWIPSIWYCGGSRTFKKKWGISTYEEYYIYKTNSDKLKIVYVPKCNRIYILKLVTAGKLVRVLNR